MERKAKILDGIDYASQRGLEIGALAWPTVAPTEANVSFVDFIDAAGLREKYATDPHVDCARIVEVDHIWSGAPGLRGVLREQQFDFIIASHVVEHVPDLVTWLAELSSVLSPRGEIRLVVPDRRFTFDYLRCESTLADIVEAWVEQRRVPSPRAIVDTVVNFVPLDRKLAWSGVAPVVERRPIEAASGVVGMAREAVEGGVYHDVHSWVFTPRTFASLMADLVRLDVLRLECTCFHDTGEGEFEFFVGLRRTDDPAHAAASWLSMASRAADAPWERASELAGSAVRANYDAAVAQLSAARDEAEMLRRSTSWQVTAPLRRLRSVLGRGRPPSDGLNETPSERRAAPTIARAIAVAAAPPAPDTQSNTGGSAMRMPGVLLRSPGSHFGDRVFFCRQGRRHWVTDARWLTENGFRWPEDVTDLPVEILDAFLPARPAPRRWTAADWVSPPSDNTMHMRELLASRLRGEGYEIGAGSSPLPIPLECEVRYIDLYDESGLVEQRYEGQQIPDLIPPDIQASFDDLGALGDASGDFFASCHVIEHTSSPMRSIFDAYRKLRPGGHIAFVVPEMTRTFDRNRALTTLDHLIEDFHHPDHERDALHFQEFYSKAFVTPADSYEQVWRQKWEEGYPIHYHTWTHDSFVAMIHFMSETLCPFVNVWSHPVLEHPDSNEFYVIAQKPR